MYRIRYSTRTMNQLRYSYSYYGTGTVYSCMMISAYTVYVRTSTTRTGTSTSTVQPYQLFLYVYCYCTSWGSGADRCIPQTLSCIQKHTTVVQNCNTRQGLCCIDAEIVSICRIMPRACQYAELCRERVNMPNYAASVPILSEILSATIFPP